MWYSALLPPCSFESRQFKPYDGSRVNIASLLFPQASEIPLLGGVLFFINDQSWCKSRTKLYDIQLEKYDRQSIFRLNWCDKCWIIFQQGDTANISCWAPLLHMEIFLGKARPHAQTVILHKSARLITDCYYLGLLFLIFPTSLDIVGVAGSIPAAPTITSRSEEHQPSIQKAVKFEPEDAEYRQEQDKFCHRHHD